MAYDLAKDLIIPEAEKTIDSIKKLFNTFTSKAQSHLKESAARGALTMALRAKEALIEVEGALTDALDDLERERNEGHTLTKE
jgi:vacuolar-type H+-ATPase subunit E/Vma4